MAHTRKAPTSRRTRRKSPSRRAATGLRALNAAKRVIEEVLHECCALHHEHGPLGHKKLHDVELRNLVGVAIGHSHVTDGATHSESAAPGEPVLLMLLETPRRHSEVRALLKRLLRGSASIPFDIIVTGAVRPHAQTFRLRPAAAGTSVSHCSAASGTFGFLARGRSGPRAGQLFVVSNCHVLTPDGVAPPVRGVAQPGRTDGGTCPADQIAVVERVIPIQFGGSNRVDAAAAIAPPAVVRRELMFLQGGQMKFTRLGAPAPATAGMMVGKSGRSTNLTMGRVLSISSSVVATYGTRTALFLNQILVAGTAGPFSDSGDSGSLVFTWNEQRNPVGMLFGGANGVSFVNHIEDVLNALDVDFA